MLCSTGHTIEVFNGWKFQNEKTTCQRQSFDHYSACQGRSLR